MKKLIVITALAASLAAPAFADAAFAVRHFNQDLDSVLERAIVPTTPQGVVVSTNSRSDLSVAFAMFNAVQDSVGDLRGMNGATVYRSGHSGAAADIFADLRAESREDE